ncbi:MAG TPA: tRNA (adenosine(37)-N6)-threonylcarbamoyltransferase complex dimerization subunit type 1 TsaB [Thermoanaerobaculia bacterium]|nr:tRNA (adenosine(37)-N6)-threonylcarbamoyltransferase complex dimerization subunit type 1 TsaB [Thermoanaerobaculia bacterium]
MPDPLLVLDTGSPLVSVAVGRGGTVVAERSVELGRSSARLLDMMAEVLEEAGLKPRDLGGIAVLRGPGSFTGVRIGLATILGMHQALGVPATGLSTLEALAASVQDRTEGTVLAAVDALRGDWSARAFAAAPLPRPVGEEGLVPGSELPRLAGGGPAVVIGFGVSRLAELPGWPAEIRLMEAGPLAPAAVRLASAPDAVWDAGLLTRPIYSRPPAITPPKPRER